MHDPAHFVACPTIGDLTFDPLQQRASQPNTTPHAAKKRLVATIETTSGRLQSSKPFSSAPAHSAGPIDRPEMPATIGPYATPTVAIAISGHCVAMLCVVSNT